MVRAYSVGVAILAVSHAAWLVFLQTRQYWAVLYGQLWLAPFAAGLVSAWLAPRSRLPLGASMAIPFALLAVISNAIYGSELPGLAGAVFVFAFYFVQGGVIAGFGAWGGSVLAEKFRRSPRAERTSDGPRR